MDRTRLLSGVSAIISGASVVLTAVSWAAVLGVHIHSGFLTPYVFAIFGIAWIAFGGWVLGNASKEAGTATANAKPTPTN